MASRQILRRLSTSLRGRATLTLPAGRQTVQVPRRDIANISSNSLRRWFATESEAKTEEEKSKDGEVKAEESKKEDSAESSEKKETEELVQAPEELLAKELAQLQEDIRAKKHELLLSLADFENNKKRFQKEREDRRKRATANFATAMIEVYTDFDKVAMLPHSGKCEALHEGVALTHNLFKSTLDRFGVRQFEAELGTPFLSARHENVGTIDSDFPANSVAEQVHPGWILDADSPKPVVVRKVAVKVATHGPEAPTS